MADACFVCGGDVEESERHVLVRGRRQDVCCSEACLLADVAARRRAKAVRWSRALVGASALGGLLLGVSWFRSHLHAPRPRAISSAWPEVLEPDTPPPAPIVFGPPWPPTDAQWLALFDGAAWTHPLSGPVRRPPRASVRGVDLGGDLWGEHVYAALDGVVERVHGDGNGSSVRLVHFGGTVFTQYLHLAGTPRGLVRGARVAAGDVIGLVGDTDLESARPSMHFALSVRPSNDLAEVYWDPTPWLARAALTVPAHGTVAGFVPGETPPVRSSSN